MSPPSETENVAVAAAAPALATGDEKSPAHLPIEPNNSQCPNKSSIEKQNSLTNTNNGAIENKNGGATPPAAASVDSASKTDDTTNGSVVVNNDALHSTNIINTPATESKTDTMSISSSSSPRRKVKKKRSDDFVYADTKKEDPPASSTAENQNGATKSPPVPTKKPKQRKRPKQCPSSDSILMDVPLSVTADLGVALKRTRRKRIKRIQDWLASAPDSTNNNKTDMKKKKKKKSLKQQDDDHAKGEKDSCSDSDDDDDDNEKDITLDYDDDALGKTPKRNQYGSVLDYLEAKYVRGVMLADYDDGEQAKVQSNGVKEDEVDSEGDNSCYDDEDGFIDDSLMLEDVAGQVMASSTYGLTQIEEEARRRKEERKKESAITEQLGITDEKLDDTQVDEGIESGLDDGFFVNLGDLEMAEGWSGDNVVISPTKKKKRTKKRVKAAAAKDDATTTKKKKKLSSPSSPKKKKKADDTKQKSDNKDNKATSPKKGKKTPSGKSEEKQPKKKDQVAKHPKKTVSPEKEKATQLRKVMKRKYNACVKMIKDLSTDHLPLKQRNKKTVKLSVSIPADKNIGDEITFANPNIPGK